MLTKVPDDALVMTDEPFGPVVPITPFSTAEEAIRRANSVPYGLASYVFTESLAHARLASERLEAGMVNINHFGIALAETPRTMKSGSPSMMTVACCVSESTSALAPSAGVKP